VSNDATLIATAGNRADIVGGAWTVNVTGNVTVNADGSAKFAGTGGTEVGSAGSQTQVNGQQVLLAGGGPGVARLGDRVITVGNLGMPATGTIIQGSTKVLSG
jgi:hypothetical protein